MNIDHVNIALLEKMCTYLLDGEPVFIMRARDAATPSAIEGYIERTMVMGGRNVARCKEKLKIVRDWQIENQERVRTAD